MKYRVTYSVCDKTTGRVFGTVPFEVDAEDESQARMRAGMRRAERCNPLWFRGGFDDVARNTEYKVAHVEKLL